jgi:hypothetical protein
MRTHLGQVTSRLLVPLLLVGCQETSTAPRGDETGDKSGGGRMNPAVAASSGRTQNFHFVTKGEFAEVTWAEEFGGFPGLSGLVRVARGGTASKPEVFLFYLVTQCESEFSCFALEAGAGLIPVGDFRAGAQSAKLRTNTSTNPNVELLAGNGGLISVEWDTRGIENRVIGTFEQRIKGVLRSRSTGDFTAFSGTATGSMAGTPIPTAPKVLFAQNGKSRNLSVEHVFRP